MWKLGAIFENVLNLLSFFMKINITALTQCLTLNDKFI